MSEVSVTEHYASKASDNGILLGGLQPSRESKGAWSEVYLYENKLVEVIYSDPVDAWVVAGNIIEKKDLIKSVLDVKDALSIINKNR
jgi:hypothetical protein